MSKLKNYLKGIMEQDFDKVKIVPEFDTGDEARAWVRKLKLNDRVDADVIDPETGEVLMDAQTSKSEIRNKKPASKVSKPADKFREYLTKARSKKINGLKEKENKENPDAAFNLVLQEVSDHFRKMGKDIAFDYENDDEFKDRAAEMAGDTADGIFQMMEPNHKRMIQYLKAKGIKDVKGWIADEIYDGMGI